MSDENKGIGEFELEMWTREAVAAKEHATNFLIETDEDYKEAGHLLVLVKTRFKTMDDARSSEVGPINAKVKAVNDRYRAALNALRDVESRLKDLMGKWMQKQREEQQRLLMEAQAAAQGQSTIDTTQAGLRLASSLIDAAKQAAPSRLHGISGRDVWRVEVVDPDLVPREFCSPDLLKLQKAVDAGATAIPGVKITAEVQIRAARA